MSHQLASLVTSKVSAPGESEAAGAIWRITIPPGHPAGEQLVCVVDPGVTLKIPVPLSVRPGEQLLVRIPSCIEKTSTTAGDQDRSKRTAGIPGTQVTAPATARVPLNMALLPPNMQPHSPPARLGLGSPSVKAHK